MAAERTAKPALDPVEHRGSVTVGSGGAGRRAAARRWTTPAAHLVDRVLPSVPTRQWVLTLPFGLRLLCAFRPEVLSLVVRAWTRAVFALYRGRARMLGFGRGQCGAVTVIQRAGSACELNVHFHTLVLDGVYVEEDSGALGFRPLPAPTRAQLDQVARAVARKVRRALRRAGLEDEAALPDSAAAEPELAALVGESVAFPRDRVVEPEHARSADARTVASAEGYNLHAGVALSALDHAGRERLCKYLLRPPLSDDRLRLRDDGRVELRLKTPWRDGTVALVLTPEQLVARLAALVPRPEKNLIRYHGVLAPAAPDRAQVIPAPPVPAEPRGDRADTSARNPSPNRTGRYLLWAELLRRVFRAEVEKCPRCAGRMRLICAVLDGHSLSRYLRALRAAAPAARARPPPALVREVVVPAAS
jgi:hypothetical protein